MTTALLADDFVTGGVIAALLTRVGVDAKVFLKPGGDASAAMPRVVDVLSLDHAGVVIVNGAARMSGARDLPVTPSLEAWLTRDPAANRAVLGTDEVPAPEAAHRWLHSHAIVDTAGPRQYSTAIHGVALAARMDLSVLAEFSLPFRELIGALRPGWATTQPIKRGRGRPPGVAMFRGTGYAMCLELLHLGRGAHVTPGAMIAALGRTKTPISRLLNECRSRGYVHRVSARKPLIIRNTARLVDDLVADARARRAATPRSLLELSTDRDPASLVARLSRRLGERGRLLAVTGARALLDLGGEALIDSTTLAYANLEGIEPMLGDAYPDPRNPRLVLIEPLEEGVLHRMRAGMPAMVAPWQAVIDLLASESEREREIGGEVRRRLERENGTR